MDFPRSLSASNHVFSEENLRVILDSPKTLPASNNNGFSSELLCV